MPKQATFILLLFALFFFQCGKNKSDNPADQLPPETQTGAESFGCLVNGKVFTPKGSSFGGSILSAAYQYIDGGYYFQLAAKRQNDVLTSISIHTDSLSIQQNKSYPLDDFYRKGTSSGRYSSGMISASTEYLTTSSTKGELYITKFDETNRIVSGTFGFDAVNDAGEKVEVRQGRFDLHYTL